MAEQEKKKLCFVIAPINKEGSEVRKRSDMIMEIVIKPAAEKCGYAEPTRADHDSNPGVITTHIIQQLLDASLVVADLTDYNPNVFYELAVRHAFRKPIVQIIAEGQTIPFDVAPIRTISLDHTDVVSMNKAKGEMVKQIRAVEEDPSKADSPITQTLDLTMLRGSSNATENALAETRMILGDIWTRLQTLTVKMGEIDDRLAVNQRSPLSSMTLSDAIKAARAKDLGEILGRRDQPPSSSPDSLINLIDPPPMHFEIANPPPPPDETPPENDT